MYPPRQDHPGARWLITNRGVAKRAVFETRQDVERFYDALSDVVSLGLIEVHAFVFMTTHFHLSLTSVYGDVSRAMCLATNAFVRWWNRSRRRDGPLFHRRFHGRRIGDDAHWVATLRYIDLNPVRAGMCRVPSDHPFGSARAYRFGTGPEWLSRREVNRTVQDADTRKPFSGADYDAFVCAADADADEYLVEHAARHPDRPPPPLEDLIRTASRRDRAWMEWKAALADGMSVGAAFLPPRAALRAARIVGRHLARNPLPTGRANVERNVAAGLLRTAAGRRIGEIATDLAVAQSTALKAVRRHDSWMNESPRYADVVARALQGAVRRTFPPLTGPSAGR